MKCLEVNAHTYTQYIYPLSMRMCAARLCNPYITVFQKMFSLLFNMDNKILYGGSQISLSCIVLPISFQNRFDMHQFGSFISRKPLRGGERPQKRFYILQLKARFWCHSYRLKKRIIKRTPYRNYLKICHVLVSWPKNIRKFKIYAQKLPLSNLCHVSFSAFLKSLF